MESLVGPQQKQEIINMGKEFAFEGLDARYFKANNAEELKLFKEGYEEGLKIIQSNSNQNQMQETQGMKRAS